MKLMIASPKFASLKLIAYSILLDLRRVPVIEIHGENMRVLDILIF
jgi:hypothetical protein